MSDNPPDVTPEGKITFDHPPSSSDFYIIAVNALDWDWYHILARMMNKIEKGVGKLEAVDAFVGQSGSMTIYYFRRTKVPASYLAEAFGIEEKALAGATTIKLKALGGQDKWQKPTVPYIGEA